MPEICTTCPYCGVGCGVVADVDGDTNNVMLRASQTHPANFGRLCSKGSALDETILPTPASLENTQKEDYQAALDQRITQPTIDGDVVDWGAASEAVAQRIQDSITEYGKDSVAFYLSGQLLTEDYYVANKLMKGFIGTANVDTNSRLCMSSAVAAYKRAFGADAVPCSYEDLEHADLLVLIGSNAAWTHPVLYQRMLAAKQSNPNLRVVLIDPRATATNDLADLHLRIQPSSDGFLFQGLLHYLIDNDALDADYIEKNTDGFAQSAQAVASLDLSATAAHTKVNEAQLKTFFSWFAKTSKTVSFYSQGINQSATGTDKCNAIINCHLATGKLGYAGAGPFSITGQPNAMGGREVGGLANQLAAHMDFAPDDIDRVQRFWQSPDIASQPGLKAVDLFDAIHDGKIKVVWIMATNPAVSLPDSNKVQEALSKCPTVIVSDVAHTDTTAYADIVLPALAWSEKDGTVTNSERRISRQRAFRSGPAMAKADWWALSQVADKMGHGKAFLYQSSRDIFVEHAQLSAFENNGSRDFDISALSELTEQQYASLEPLQWPVNKAQPDGTARLFTDGRFFTPTGRAQFVSNGAQLSASLDDAEHPLLLNTGRLRDQWHTMSRTGLAAKLSSHDDLPYIEIHASDASHYGLKKNQFAKLSNKYGRFIGRVEISNKVSAGELFSPIHWNQQFAQDSVISAVVDREVDPVSGQPEAKASAVSIASFDCLQWARLITLDKVDGDGFDYWASSKTKHGYITLLGINRDYDWQSLLRSLSNDQVSVMRFSDQVFKVDRIALIDAERRLQGMLFTDSNVENLPSYAWLEAAFENTSGAQVAGLMMGESGVPDKAICSCFNVTEKAINQSIEQGNDDQSLLAQSLGCGSKCGSCQPEIRALLKQYRNEGLH